jgi:hypothetical protein
MQTALASMDFLDAKIEVAQGHLRDLSQRLDTAWGVSSSLESLLLAPYPGSGSGRFNGQGWEADAVTTVSAAHMAYNSLYREFMYGCVVVQGLVARMAQVQDEYNTLALEYDEATKGAVDMAAIAAELAGEEVDTDDFCAPYDDYDPPQLRKRRRATPSRKEKPRSVRTAATLATPTA